MSDQEHEDDPDNHVANAEVVQQEERVSCEEEEAFGTNEKEAPLAEAELNDPSAANLDARLKQEPGETIEDFVRRMRLLVEKYYSTRSDKPIAMKERLLKELLVCGIADDRPANTSQSHRSRHRQPPFNYNTPNRTRRCFCCGSTSHMVAVCPDRQYGATRSDAIYNSYQYRNPRPRDSRSRNATPRSPVRCFECQGPHYRNNCPHLGRLPGGSRDNERSFDQRPASFSQTIYLSCANDQR